VGLLPGSCGHEPRDGQEIPFTFHPLPYLIHGFQMLFEVEKPVQVTSSYQEKSDKEKPPTDYADWGFVQTF